MSITRLRQQGGAVILTIPSNLISKMNWSIGMELNITTEHESLCIAPSRRIPRGRKSVSQLVSEIDTCEIEFLNKSMDELNNSPSVGKEIFLMVKVNVPSKGDIWLINPDPTNGNELKGSHYFIVITESALNKSLGVSICCPISTVATSARSAGVTVSISGDSTKKGTVRGVVLCHQVRALDLKNRNAKFHTKAEPHLIDEVIMKLVDIIDPQP